METQSLTVGEKRPGQFLLSSCSTRESLHANMLSQASASAFVAFWLSLCPRHANLQFSHDTLFYVLA